ncbi:T9SS type A sorting domain-containing protein [Hymenobacter ruricola]|uniref:T9SS type A sorting domain-containing protein n=1 Tax=Hymenobacter ruricola TaxID=2791023 RepID=A0ABS0HZP8_9BACT|nr:T9SS type A sorting domain-containing protein [Hymenobacter ruricola]MBF9220180.1 T9SS type A sorting domain-containing protein [Hymenobacter ruricola]
MNKPLLTLTLLAAGFTAAAQTPITITQADFPAAAGAAERYQDANLPASVSATPTGANQAWDYRSLTPSGQAYALPYLPVPANSSIAGAQWTRARTAPVGFLAYNITSYYSLTANGRISLGRTVARQATSLRALTGGANDSVVINRQTISLGAGLVDVALPLSAGAHYRRSFRYATTGIITVATAGLNQVPFRLVKRGTYTDSVAGWGTVRVPVAGSATGSSAIPVLQVRTLSVEQDSVYLNGAPAPAALLQVLNMTQGAITQYYQDDFRRRNSIQPVLSLYYATAQFGTPYTASYSTESTLLAVRNALATELGGLSAYPNPVARGPLTLWAGNGSRQPLRLTVRDVLGRALATAAAATGQPTAVLDGLPAGTYLLEAEGPTGARSTLRVVRE